LHLIGALWDSVTNLLLHLARKPSLEKEQEKDKRISLQTILPQEIPNLHETPNKSTTSKTYPTFTNSTLHSTFTKFTIS